MIWFNPLLCFFGSEGHVALDRNPGTGYDILFLRMIPGDLLSAFPHRQFHTLPGLLDSWAALPNSNSNALCAMQGGSLYYFYDGLWYDLAGRRTHNLPCERRTRYRLSQPNTVLLMNRYTCIYTKIILNTRNYFIMSLRQFRSNRLTVLSADMMYLLRTTVYRHSLLVSAHQSR